LGFSPFFGSDCGGWGQKERKDRRNAVSYILEEVGDGIRRGRRKEGRKEGRLQQNPDTNKCV
jgi:hypothetical protein